MLITSILSQVPPERRVSQPEVHSTGAPRHFLLHGDSPERQIPLGIRLRDDGRRLSAVTQGIPKPFVYCCLAVPIAVAAGIFFYRLWAYGKLEWMILPFFILTPLVVIEFEGVINWLNRRGGAGEARAILDRSARTLELRDGRSLIDRSSVVELILLRGWQIQKSSEGTNCDWLNELSIVAKADDGRLLRWHVATGSGRTLNKLADEIVRVLGCKVVRERVRKR